MVGNLFEKAITEDSIIPIENHSKEIDYDVTMNNGVIYYHKTSWNYNEMIGEELSKLLDVPSAHYEPVYWHKLLCYRSPNFKDKSLDYTNIYDVDEVKEKRKRFDSSTVFGDLNVYDSDNDIRDFMAKYHMKESEYQKLLKLIAIDIFMRQTDRCEVNMMLSSDDKFKTTSLAPLYDFTSSFSPYHYSRKNPLGKIYDKYPSCIMDIGLVDTDELGYGPQVTFLDKVLNKNPELSKYLSIVTSLDLLKLIERILKRYQMEFTEEAKLFYEEQQEISKIIIKPYL